MFATMRIWIAIGIAVLSSVAYAEPPPSPRIAALSAKLAAHERGAEEAFWRQLAVEGTPIIEDVHEAGRLLVTFVWRGKPDTQRVRLFGPVDHMAEDSDLERIPGSNVFAHSVSLPDTARFTYLFGFDGDPAKPGRHFDLNTAVTRRDPVSKHPFGTAESFVELPRAPPQPWIVPHRGVAAGTVWLHEIRAAAGQPPRRVTVYTPPGYTATGKPYPLVVAFDAESATTQIPLPMILDELIAAKRIPPVVALMIGNVDRMSDLQPNPAFIDMVALDLVPWMRASYHATSDPRLTVLSGVSLGGLASAYGALRHSEVFGNVLSQSGSFWWGTPPGATAHDYATTPRLPIRFWMEVGTFEFGSPTKETVQLAANRHMHDVLLARGYEIGYREFAGNHTYVEWRGSIAEGLIALLATPAKLPAARTPPVAKRAALDIAPGKRSSAWWLVRTAMLDGGDAALAAARPLLANNPDGYLLEEHELESAGVALFNLGRPRDALALWRWNTERFPTSSNAWDSLGYAYQATGDRARALDCFKRELTLDPRSESAKAMLDELTSSP